MHVERADAKPPRHAVRTGTFRGRVEDAVRRRVRFHANGVDEGLSSDFPTIIVETHVGCRNNDWVKDREDTFNVIVLGKPR